MSEPDWLAETRSSYDNVAESYAEIMQGALGRQPDVRAVLAMFAELAADVGGPVADIGCGPGHVAAHLHERGLTVVGVDLSPAMIHVARRDHSGPAFTIGSMTDLQFADAALPACCSSGGSSTSPTTTSPACWPTSGEFSSLVGWC